MNKLILVISVLLLFSSSGARADHPGGTVNAHVNGLVCDFCAQAVKKVFKRQKEVNSIDVNLDEKLISIHFQEGKTLEDEVIIAKIRDSGYDVRRLEYAD